MGLGWALGFSISNKLQGDAGAAGPETTLGIVRPRWLKVLLSPELQWMRHHFEGRSRECEQMGAALPPSLVVS